MKTTHIRRATASGGVAQRRRCVRDERGGAIRGQRRREWRLMVLFPPGQRGATRELWQYGRRPMRGCEREGARNIGRRHRGPSAGDSGRRGRREWRRRSSCTCSAVQWRGRGPWTRQGCQRAASRVVEERLRYRRTCEAAAGAEAFPPQENARGQDIEHIPRAAPGAKT
eukprot:3106949-Pleurochrysis_carterae.AAC.1